MKNKKFIALIGLGYWGKNILRNLSELKVLHSACDSNPKVILERKEEFPNVNYTLLFEKILKNPDIKAVIIATPAITHYEIVKKALFEGKDVFVEKPLALKSEEGEKLVQLAEKNGKILMIGHLLQYHPAIIKLKELISSGKLGKIQYIYSNRLNIGKLRIEENVLWSFAPHDISVILMLLEDEPIEVSAFGGAYFNKEIYDTTLTTMSFKNNVKAHIFVSWLHPYKEQKLVVVGSKGMILFDDLTKEKLFFYPHKINWDNGIPVAHKAEHQIISVTNEEPLKLEIGHFIRCVEKREKPKTDGKEGLRVLKILEQAQDSLNLN